MKNIIYFLILVSLSTSSQNKYLTKTGIVEFEASVPSFEKVIAKNNSVTAIINSKTGAFAALVLIKGFRFKNALMEEHFNENYAESNQYPKATFKGQIINFSINNLNSVANVFHLKGKLTFHGKTKMLDDIIIDIKTHEGLIIISGEFLVSASNFDIKIPKVVRDKVSEDIRILFNFKLQKKQK